MYDKTEFERRRQKGIIEAHFQKNVLLKPDGDSRYCTVEGGVNLT